MKNYQKIFLNLALDAKALEFGSFTLKSGRTSPYFFNAAKMLSGNLSELANCYVQAINETEMEYDCIYGPAYKGIFLGSMVAVLLSQNGNNYPLSFDRKEVKDHGEGGLIIGAPISGKILIIDDVISAGTSINESFSLINQFDAKIVGIIVSIDRKEKGSEKLSAIEEIYKKYKVPVKSIINLDNIIGFLQKDTKNKKILDEMLGYKQKYGV